MSLKSTIDQDIKKAMLEKRKEDLIALRAIKSAILLAETEKGAGDGISEEQELKLLTKMAKQRKESAEIYQKENREDLANKELQELEIINNYLPKQLSREEIEGEVVKIIEQTGASSMKDMGKVMGMASKSLAGKADGKLISDIVKEKLA
ncbi:MAG: GatB/YqeY domain-containing protein [Cyclobacteriaceae bacterium]|nr:GatB/YqeY domain-containing protein [Cyclobacteriaceae bacterium]